MLIVVNTLFLLSVFLMLVFIISLGLVINRGAPFMPTPISKIKEMLSLAKVGKNDVVMDLGCGDGRILFTAIREFGAKEAIGYELNPFFVWWIKLRALLPLYRGKVFVRRRNLFKTDPADLREAHVITSFLLLETNKKLEPELKVQCRPGTRIVSRAFSFPTLPLIKEIGERTKIRLYTT